MKVMGFLFPAAYEVYCEEAEGNKRSNTRSGLWFPCLPRIAYWDARVESSESFICMKATNLPSTFIQGYGFHACPGLPFGDARVETSESWRSTSMTLAPAGDYFIGMREWQRVNPLSV